MELPASPSSESPDVAALRGFAEQASASVEKALEVLDSFEGIVRSFNAEEDFLVEAMATKNAIVRAEQRLIEARERLAIALDAHSSFLNARVAATMRIRAADKHGKPTIDVDDEEELDTPKFLKRKLPESSEDWKGSAGKPLRAHGSSVALCKRASWIAWRS